MFINIREYLWAYKGKDESCSKILLEILEELYPDLSILDEYTELDNLIQEDINPEESFWERFFSTETKIK